MNFFSYTVKASQKAREAIGPLVSSVSVRWNSQIDAAASALKNKDNIEKYATAPSATESFKIGTFALRLFVSFVTAIRVRIMKEIQGWDILAALGN